MKLIIFKENQEIFYLIYSNEQNTDETQKKKREDQENDEKKAHILPDGSR